MFSLRLSSSSRAILTTGNTQLLARQKPSAASFRSTPLPLLARQLSLRHNLRRFSDLKKDEPKINDTLNDELKIVQKAEVEAKEETSSKNDDENENPTYGGDFKQKQRETLYASNTFLLAGLLKVAVITVAGAVVGYLIYEGILRNSDSFFYWYSVPLIQLLPPEAAHVAAVKALALINPESREFVDPYILRTDMWGMKFSNPIGLAAGFDKHAEAIDPLFGIGFGFVECGTITPKPQPGNARPRVFRLKEDKAVINRYGFNSDGADLVKERLEKREERLKQDLRANLNLRNPVKRVLGINVGKNKETEDATSDFLIGVEKFGTLADYLVVNISSPNTPNLRALQKKESMKSLLLDVIKKRDAVCQLPDKTTAEGGKKFVPLLVKIAPDLTDDEVKDISEVCMEVKVDGIIISNTTIARAPELRSEHKNETGGLSGKPVFEKSNAVLRKVYEHTQGKIPLIGVGGVSSGKDALEKIKSGASLVQLYTAFSYGGPGLITAIKRELASLLKAEGYGSVQQAVGASVSLPVKS